MWKPRPKDIKRYPHFDAPLANAEIERIANDPLEVATNPFFPLIEVTQNWQPFRSRPGHAKPVRKERALRYAARKDAAIFARYRALLAERYESFVSSTGISKCVIGYRKIRDESGRGGKTNVHFARDAFAFIRDHSPCTVVVADISSFFESMDHHLLKERWSRLLNVERLPLDHYAVFKHATRYRVIKQSDLYAALGIARPTAKGLEYAVPKSEMRKQLADMVDLRALLNSSNPKRPNIYKHADKFGIPQGLPISDVLANIYMIDFDKSVMDWCGSRGGFYQRYSDDIICIIPGTETSDADIETMLRAEISKNGSKLQIKRSKVASGTYQADSVGRLRFSLGMGRARNGIEYLGLRFDGQRTFLRDRTLSNLNRKFKHRVRGMISAYVRRYRGKGATWLQDNFDKDAAVANFLRRENFHTLADARDWTFWTYARKAERTLSDLNPRIFQQLSGFKRRALPFVQGSLDEMI